MHCFQGKSRSAAVLSRLVSRLQPWVARLDAAHRDPRPHARRCVAAFPWPCIAPPTGPSHVSHRRQVLAGWLVWRGRRLDDALAVVRAARPVAEPNAGFLAQLRRWEAVAGPGRAGSDAGAGSLLVSAAAAVAAAATASNEKKGAATEAEQGGALMAGGRGETVMYEMR